MMKQIFAGLIIAGLGCNPAFADHDDHQRFDTYGSKSYGFKSYTETYNQGRIEQAKVIRVRPVTETVIVQVPRESCWNERISYRQQSRKEPYVSATPMIIGGLVGATIGHSLGQEKYKTNQAIKTIALGAIGASIGRDISRRHQDEYYQTSDRQPSHRHQRQCEVDYETRREKQVVAYDVTYRYRGETYHARMDYDPGKRLPIRVNVRPVI